MIKLDVKTSKNVELRRKPFKTAKLQKWSNWTSKRSKMLSYVTKHSKPLNYKSDQIGRQNEQKWWVTSQNIQNDAKLWKWSNYNELYRFDVQTIKNVELRRKPFKTAKQQKWSNWTSKRSKMLSYVAKHSKPLNYKSDQIGRQNEQKWWVTSQNIQNDAKLWKWSNYNELYRFDVQTIKNVELRRKPFKTAKLQKWSNWTSKRSKMLSYVAKHSKPLNYKSDQIGRQNEQKWWVTSQNIQNDAKLWKWSNYNELHRFDVQTIKNVELRRKTFKTTPNYKSDQKTMTCIDLMSKRSKQRKTLKVIKL